MKVIPFASSLYAPLSVLFACTGEPTAILEPPPRPKIEARGHQLPGSIVHLSLVGRDLPAEHETDWHLTRPNGSRAEIRSAGGNERKIRLDRPGEYIIEVDAWNATTEWSTTTSLDVPPLTDRFDPDAVYLAVSLRPSSREVVVPPIDSAFTGTVATGIGLWDWQDAPPMISSLGDFVYARDGRDYLERTGIYAYRCDPCGASAASLPALTPDDRLGDPNDLLLLEPQYWCAERQPSFVQVGPQGELHWRCYPGDTFILASPEGEPTAWPEGRLGYGGLMIVGGDWGTNDVFIYDTKADTRHLIHGTRPDGTAWEWEVWGGQRRAFRSSPEGFWLAELEYDPVELKYRVLLARVHVSGELEFMGYYGLELPSLVGMVLDAQLNLWVVTRGGGSSAEPLEVWRADISGETEQMVPAGSALSNVIWDLDSLVTGS